MARTLSVGSVVEREGKRLTVLGYNLVERGGHVGLAYLMAPRPLGFVSSESLMLFDAEEFDVPSQVGYADDASRALVDALDDVRGHGAEVSFAEYRAALDDLMRDVEEEEG